MLAKTEVQPVRMTDADVFVLLQHGKDSMEGQKAIARLGKRLADWIDAEGLARYERLYAK